MSTRITAAERQSELLRLVTERVERDLLAPVRRTMGDGTPVERTALEVLQYVEEVERELAGRWITLQEAVDRSGYSYDSLQRHAKLVHDGAEVGDVWASMRVRRAASGAYEVEAATVPLKPGMAA
jgi:hypothetical protein